MIIYNLNSVLLWHFSWVSAGFVDAKIGVFWESGKNGDIASFGLQPVRTP